MTQPTPTPPPATDSLMVQVMQLARKTGRVREIHLCDAEVHVGFNRKATCLPPRYPDPETVLIGIANGCLMCLVRFRYEALPLPKANSESPEEPIARVSATFMVTYDFETEIQPPDQVLEAFVSINGRMTATPYWREFLQNSLSRCDFPVPEVPPFIASDELKKLSVLPSSPV